jgi:hypothetical protein
MKTSTEPAHALDESLHENEETFTRAINLNCTELSG